MTDAGIRGVQALRAGDGAPLSRALAGDGVVLVWNDITAEGRDQFYTWHDKEHIPERLSIAGFRRGRRYLCAGHSPEWLTMYEADSLAVMTSADYLARLNAPTPATTHTLQFFRNTSRAVCQAALSTGASNGGHMLALRLQVDGAASDALMRMLGDELFPRAMGLTGVVACHLFAADQAASSIDTAESSTRSFDVPAWVVLVETTFAAAAEKVRAMLDGPELRALGARFRADAAVYALEICRVPALSQPSGATR